MEQTVTSPAAQVLVSLIPIVGIAFGAVLLFFVIRKSVADLMN